MKPKWNWNIFFIYYTLCSCLRLFCLYFSFSFLDLYICFVLFLFLVWIYQYLSISIPISLSSLSTFIDLFLLHCIFIVSLFIHLPSFSFVFFCTVVFAVKTIDIFSKICSQNVLGIFSLKFSEEFSWGPILL